MTLQTAAIEPRVISDPKLLQAETEQLIDRLMEAIDGSRGNVLIWLKAPHPDLGGRTPMSYIEEGQIEVVSALVWAIETGQPE